MNTPTDNNKCNKVPPKADWIRVGRNESCPCGSGQKFKKCCLSRVEAMQSAGPVQDADPSEIASTRQAPTASGERISLNRLKTWALSPSGKKALQPRPRQTEALGTLLQLFIDLVRKQPWLWMEDRLLFAVELPHKTIYAAVLGAEGRLYGLSIYPEEEGLQYYLSLEDRKHGGPDAVLDLEDLGPALVLVLGDEDELTSTEIKVYHSHGFNFNGQGAWPVFRSYRPGYWPWGLSLKAMNTAIIMLDAALSISKYYLQHRQQVINRFKNGEIPCFRITGSAPYERPHKWLVLPEKPRGIKQWQLTDIDMQRIHRIKKTSSAWEMDWFYLQSPFDEEDYPIPYMPVATLIADIDLQGAAPPPQLHRRAEWDLAQILVSAVSQANKKPARIIVNSSAKARALALLAAQLGIKIEVADTPNLDQLRESLESDPEL